MEKDITYQQLRMAVIQAPKRKSPGSDGISSEFYEWGVDIMKDDMFKLYNHFFQTGDIPTTQKMGVIVCLPKHTVVKRVKDYRPLTLLNTDHKIYSRILANRLKSTLRIVIHDSQYSAIP
jgi:mannosylglycoprotein endo-beta-mannosidase